MSSPPGSASAAATPTRIVCLSNVIDDHYHRARGEEVPRCLSWGKRRDLFACLATATGRQILLLSSPPKALARRSPKWLPALETEFAGHRQLVCANWDAPKIRVLCSWFFYVLHVLRNTRSGDLVLIDNYEFIYVLAAWVARVFRPGLVFVLDYEDGKHLSDRSWSRVLSWTAESVGRPLLKAALLAHPALSERLPSALPKELVPGFVRKKGTEAPRKWEGPLRFLYSGSLDAPRGVDLLIKALDSLPHEGWSLDVTGAGHFEPQFREASVSPKWAGKVRFHGTLSNEAYDSLVMACHVGLNCQRASDPVSGVTFPSKIFTYLSAGLVVLSSTASEVEQICAKACVYYREDSPQSLGQAMRRLIDLGARVAEEVDRNWAAERYSLEGTSRRLAGFFAPLLSVS
jgi:glycosyltransferase involved in cell wall biosynthesis